MSFLEAYFIIKKLMNWIILFTQILVPKGFGTDIKSYMIPTATPLGSGDQLHVQIPPITYTASSQPSSEPSSPRKLIHTHLSDRSRPRMVDQNYGKFTTQPRFELYMCLMHVMVDMWLEIGRSKPIVFWVTRYRLEACEIWGVKTAQKSVSSVENFKLLRFGVYCI